MRTDIQFATGTDALERAGAEVRILRMDARDNVAISLTGLRRGEQDSVDGAPVGLASDVPAKISTNSGLASRMSHIIGFDTGPILQGATGIAQNAESLLDCVIGVASGAAVTKAESLRQDDFIPWKRGVSL